MRRMSMVGMVMLAFSLLASGCATNRGVISLQVPDAGVPDNLNGRQVYINSVTDKRVFEENPSSADIPSLGFGGADTAGEMVRKRAIARKRNSYGKALGDILLEEGQTVESIVHKALVRALAEDGYRVVEQRERAGGETLILDAEVSKFWSWMRPGFWAITLSSEIEVKILLTAPKRDAKEIYVHSEGNYQVASGGNWIEIMNQSLDKFNDAVKEEF